MLDTLIFPGNISIVPPYAKIYSRLGYKKRITRLSLSQQKETDLLIEEAVSIISLKGSILRTIISKNDGEEITLSANLIFNSKKLAALLLNCPEAVLMGATAGSSIMDAIRKKTNQDDLAAAVVYDATASEMTDAALDWIMDYLNQRLRREGKRLLPRRFSAGYADFKLENQKMIYEKLQMDKIGVTINSGFILLPEKSVTAITGIC
jgi:Vitamin B12 dependent methionine synthase, activation domain.